MSESILPVPSTTDESGSSAITTGRPVSIINLGGGYRVKALQNEHEVDYRDIGERLRRLFGNYATETGIKPRLEIEPGTYLVANCGSLVTSVLDVTAPRVPKRSAAQMSGGKSMYSLPVAPLVAESAPNTMKPIAMITSASAMDSP